MVRTNRRRTGKADTAGAGINSLPMACFDYPLPNLGPFIALAVFFPNDNSDIHSGRFKKAEKISSICFNRRYNCREQHYKNHQN